MTLALRLPICKLWLLAIALLALPSHADPAFPDKPLKLIVPFAAGGSTDLVARVFADQLRHELGQPVIVDNRAGAGGMLGSESVSKADADGYTLGMATVSTMTVNPIFYERSVSANQQLIPLLRLVNMPLVIAIHPGFPGKDFASFVAELKKKPGEYSAGTSGTGSAGDLTVEAFNEAMGVRLQRVPYRGMGPAHIDAIAGQIHVIVDQVPAVLQHVKSGKLLAVVVASENRMPELPQIPTLKELGYGELNDLYQTWFGIVIPAKTPTAIADKLRAAATRAVQAPEVKARLEQMGAHVAVADTRAFRALIDTQLERNRRIVQRAGIKLE